MTWADQEYHRIFDPVAKAHNRLWGQFNFLEGPHPGDGLAERVCAHVVQRDHMLRQWLKSQDHADNQVARRTVVRLDIGSPEEVVLPRATPQTIEHFRRTPFAQILVALYMYGEVNRYGMECIVRLWWGRFRAQCEADPNSPESEQPRGKRLGRAVALIMAHGRRRRNKPKAAEDHTLGSIAFCPMGRLQDLANRLRRRKARRG